MVWHLPNALPQHIVNSSSISTLPSAGAELLRVHVNPSHPLRLPYSGIDLKLSNVVPVISPWVLHKFPPFIILSSIPYVVCSQFVQYAMLNIIPLALTAKLG
jgi:hypothetical protein